MRKTRVVPNPGTTLFLLWDI